MREILSMYKKRNSSQGNIITGIKIIILFTTNTETTLAPDSSRVKCYKFYIINATPLTMGYDNGEQSRCMGILQFHLVSQGIEMRFNHR